MALRIWSEADDGVPSNTLARRSLAPSSTRLHQAANPKYLFLHIFLFSCYYFIFIFFTPPDAVTLNDRDVLVEARRGDCTTARSHQLVRRLPLHRFLDHSYVYIHVYYYFPLEKRCLLILRISKEGPESSDVSMIFCAPSFSTVHLVVFKTICILYFIFHIFYLDDASSGSGWTRLSSPLSSASPLPQRVASQNSL